MSEKEIKKFKSCGRPMKSISQLGQSKQYVYYCDNPECEMYQKNVETT